GSPSVAELPLKILQAPLSFQSCPELFVLDPNMHGEDAVSGNPAWNLRGPRGTVLKCIQTFKLHSRIEAKFSPGSHTYRHTCVCGSERNAFRNNGPHNMVCIATLFILFFF
ncbi:mCG1036768, partial [Mus musculus]